ncbi:MAG: hypothetical protein A3F72_21220 [Bacteroidetes bacterium RIFCSPLOWO2_12_FULL_35_15]|nr:MAG: hypothetical protein A3F72_21220 [Bacteroidetes bacterium RIFCSPLOWO2_12_FULL_35_15]
MKQKLIILISLVLFSFSGIAQDGQTIFTTRCAACHTIGNGRLVGPDLKGVNKKYNFKYLIKWIKSSQTVIATDAKAKALFEEYNSIVMPDFLDLKDSDIKGIVDYIKTQSGEATTASVSTAPTEDKKNTTPEVLASSLTPQSTEAAPIEAKQDLNTASTTNNSATAAPAVKIAAASLIGENSSESPITLILTSVTLLLLVVVMFMALRIFIVIRSMDKENSAN